MNGQVRILVIGAVLPAQHGHCCKKGGADVVLVDKAVVARSARALCCRHLCGLFPGADNLDDGLRR